MKKSEKMAYKTDVLAKSVRVRTSACSDVSVFMTCVEQVRGDSIVRPVPFIILLDVTKSIESNAPTFKDRTVFLPAWRDACIHFIFVIFVQRC